MHSIAKYIGVVSAVIIAGCASPTTVTVSDCAGVDCGSVMLVVHHAKSAQGDQPYSRIAKYIVTVSGPGIMEPLVGEFPCNATEGVIEGVPAGKDRIVTVEAINEDDWALRQGEEAGVKVSGGSTSDVDVTLEPVPVFTNLKKESIVENTRLIFRVYSEALDPIVIEDLYHAQADLLVDPTSSVPEIAFNQSTGLGILAPRVRSIGEHAFTVRNAVTGRANTAQVRLLDGARRKGAPFVAGSNLGAFSTRAGEGFGFVTTTTNQPMGLFSGLTLILE